MVGPRHDRPTPNDIARVIAQRDEMRARARQGSMCGEVTAWVAATFGWPQCGGTFVTPEGEVCFWHVWNVLPDRAIFDPTADQMGLGWECPVWTPDDPVHARYVPARWVLEPGDAYAERIRVRGMFWWVPPDLRHHADAYMAKRDLLYVRGIVP